MLVWPVHRLQKVLNRPKVTDKASCMEFSLRAFECKYFEGGKYLSAAPSKHAMLVTFHYYQISSSK